MRINYQTGDYETFNAYVQPQEIINGEKNIYLGGNIETLEKNFSEKPLEFRDSRIFLFNSYSHYLETNIERIISHEIIHLTIWDLTQSMKTVEDFDNIDLPPQRSVTGFSPPS